MFLEGMNITKGRINLLREMTHRNIRIEGPSQLVSPKGTAMGTRVEIVFPNMEAIAL